MRARSGWRGPAHADGTWTQFVDPDGMCLRIIHDAGGPQAFLGVHFGADGATHFYETPRLVFAQPPISDKANEGHDGISEFGT